ncbi:hypothetical protein BRD17_01625 [Halobacteriales archaeon SW_7_68_16]|nr:MAG: hypothetical protein BRD17_01625 [Halobacteriales archaeon SW_7_68_16]
MRVRKKPVEVEIERVEERTEIETREGVVVAEPGEYVVIGVEGERYPIAPDILAATYEPVDEAARAEWKRRFED